MDKGKKKATLVMALIALLLLLSACGGSAPGSAGAANSSENANSGSSGSSESNSAQPQTNISLKDTEVAYGETVIALDQDIAEVAAALGDAEDVQESKSCLYEGMDKVFTYPDLIIHTYPDGDKDRVDAVEILSEKVAIASGIQVGDSREKLTTAYGSDLSEEGAELLRLERDAFGIDFYMADGNIEAIELYRQVD